MIPGSAGEPVAEQRERSCVLLADDRWQEVKPLLANLAREIDLVCESDASRILARIDDLPGIGAVLLDLRFEGQTLQGVDVLDQIKDRYPDLPVIVLTAVSDVALALKLVHQGGKAYYYFVKDEVDPEQLGKAVENAIRHYTVLRDRFRLTDRGRIVGSSPALDRVMRLVARVAQADAPVLVTGEPGTGKELVARAIHLGSARRAKPFVVVNCAAIPQELVASELFGTVKGAFTQAASRKGFFEQANHGTLFLDEIAELPVGTQATLLRAVEYGEVQRVGGETVAVDVRIVAATNRDPAEAVEQGRLRSDLFYRLSVLSIEIPPLRERPGDIPLLIEHILATDHPGKTITDEAIAALQARKWPGNVRELRGALHRAVLLSPGDEIGCESLPAVADREPPAEARTPQDWAAAILGNAASWADLKAEFRGSSATLREVVDHMIRLWKQEHGERPSGEELASLLGTNRNHVNQILSQLGVRLKDYDR